MKPNFPLQIELRAPVGVLGIYCEDEMLAGISFLGSDRAVKQTRDTFAKEVCAQLYAYFENADFQFDLPLKLSGTDHQLKVWQAMRDIPSGSVQTYGGLSTIIHSSPRAIGQACGNNPIPIVIPCHRVVSKTGLGGFMHSSENSVLDIKRWLLLHEQH
jgi:methylated-DNA-[protein]-cysteine S-methyltransferase